jgi:hypothetical protein
MVLCLGTQSVLGGPKIILVFIIGTSWYYDQAHRQCYMIQKLFVCYSFKL